MVGPADDDVSDAGKLIEATMTAAVTSVLNQAVLWDTPGPIRAGTWWRRASSSSKVRSFRGRVVSSHRIIL